MLDLSNKLLQTDVDFIKQEMVGVVGQIRLSRSRDIDPDVADNTVFSYGEPAIQASDNDGCVKGDSGTLLADVKGFIFYENSGVINAGTVDGAQVGGYATPMYRNLPTLKQGLIYLSASGDLVEGDTLYLVVDNAQTGYGKVAASNVTGSIDISSIAKIHADAKNGVVLVDVNII